MTNINPFKIIMKVRTAMWYLFFLTIGVWLLSSCEQKELCYDHNHASNVKVTFDWEQHPNANPASMCFYLFPREEGERTLKREFIGKNGGIAQALVGVSYTALGFNSDARNTSFRNNIRTNSIEASSKDAGTIDRIGISASLLPRAKGTEGERMSMEADSIYSGASEKDILISLEENDRGDTCKITLSPKRRFCTYRLKIMNIANQQNLSSSIAGSISGLAGGINLSTGEKTEAKVTVPFAVGTTNESTLEGQLRCYGNSPSEDAANYLVIYTMLKDGTKWCYIYDVTKQIKEAPNPYEVEIVLDKLLQHSIPMVVVTAIGLRLTTTHQRTGTTFQRVTEKLSLTLAQRDGDCQPRQNIATSQPRHSLGMQQILVVPITAIGSLLLVIAAAATVA